MMRLKILCALSVWAVLMLPQNLWADGNDEEEIRSMVATYLQLVNEGNAEEILKLYTDDAVAMIPFGPSLEGKDALRKESFGTHQEVKFDLAYDIKEVVVSGDWAFARTTVDGILTLKAIEASALDKMKMIQIFNKQDDGSWKIARFIFNPSTPLK